MYENNNRDQKFKIGIILFIISIGVMSALLFFMWDSIDFELRINENVSNPYSKTTAAQMFTVIIMMPLSYSIIFSMWVLHAYGILTKFRSFLEKSYLQKIKVATYTNPIHFFEIFLNYPRTKRGFFKFFPICVLINFSIYYIILQFSINELIDMLKFDIGTIIFPWTIFPKETYVRDSLIFVSLFTLAGPIILSTLHSMINLDKNRDIKRKISKLLLLYFYSVLIITIANIVLRMYFIPSIFSPTFFLDLHYRWFEFFISMAFTYGLIISIFIFKLELVFFKKN